MDIEKLIERLRNNNIENNCHDCALGYYAFEAAAALSTLQDENEKLRETVDKYATAARVIALHLKPFCDESLPYDEMIADAARKASDELEQVKQERDEAIKTIFQWTGCPECKWWDSADEWCEKHDRSADSCGGCCSPEWRGQKEG
jgi:hypothetical protein|nr:MAG TPA: hypothetical protein [Caudoviricetes sp.]